MVKAPEGVFEHKHCFSNREDLEAAEAQDGILVITEAWAPPQINGVAMSYVKVVRELTERNIPAHVITPWNFKKKHRWKASKKDNVELILNLRKIAKRVQKVIEKTAPQKVIIATEGPMGLAAATFCEVNGIEYIAPYHTKLPEYLEKRLGIPPDMTYEYLLRIHNQATATLARSEHDAQNLRDHGFERVKVWPGGVDTEREFFPEFVDGEEDKWEYLSTLEEIESLDPQDKPEKKKPLQLDPSLPTFVYLGRIASEKSVEEFTSSQIPANRIVIGAGPDLGKLMKQTQSAQDPNTHYLGKITDKETLRKILSAADGFVMPSETETYGGVIAEAAACGTGVIMKPDQPFSAEVEEAQIGVVAQDMDEGIRQFLEQGMDQNMTERTRAHAVEHHSIQRSVDTLVKHIGYKVARASIARRIAAKLRIGPPFQSLQFLRLWPGQPMRPASL